MARFDQWTVLRIVEVLLVLACLAFKRYTDDEARSIFLYLQKLSREWSLLTNITWNKIGSSVADATYGGYLIITITLLLGKLLGELPTKKRIVEWILLGAGAILFIALGSLAFASIESVEPSLVDNAAILGTLSLVTGMLFLLDMAGPKAPKEPPPSSPPAQIRIDNNNKKFDNGTRLEPEIVIESRNGHGPVEQPKQPDIQRQVEKARQVTPKLTRQPSKSPKDKRRTKKELRSNGTNKNGSAPNLAKETNSNVPEKSYNIHLDRPSKGYLQMKNDDDEVDLPKRFGIYGKDVAAPDPYVTDTDETASIPPRVQLHAPVWSDVRKERVRIYNIPSAVFPKIIGTDEEDDSDRPPSRPTDPGYVQYTARHWDDRKARKEGRTPRHSPTEV